MQSPSIHPALLATATAILAAGCAAPSGTFQPLSAREKTTLLREARRPDTLGIKIHQDEHGRLHEDNVRNITLGASVQVRLLPGKTPAVQVRVNNRLVPTLIDTGLISSIMTAREARSSGLTPLSGHPAKPGEARGLIRTALPTPAGTIDAFRAIARVAALERLKIYNMTFCIPDERRGLEPFWWYTDKAEAVIGNDLLREMGRITIDPGRFLGLAVSGRYRPDPKRLVAALPFTIVGGLPAVQATIGGHGPVSVIICTGGDFGLLVPRDLATEWEWPPPSPPSPEARTTSPVAETGRRTLDISGFKAGDIQVSVATDDARAGAIDTPLLGMNVLGRYVVTLDYTAYKVYLEQPDH